MQQSPRNWPGEGGYPEEGHPFGFIRIRHRGWPALSLLMLVAFGVRWTPIPLVAQSIQAVDHPRFGPILPRQKSHTAPPDHHVTFGAKVPSAYVFPRDNVIPQVVDGAGWRASFSFANLDSRTVVFTIYFFDDAGNAMSLDVSGVGMTSGVKITLPIYQAITFETPGTKVNLSQGFGYIEREDISYVIGGQCVFRQRVNGRPDFEAVVPLVNELDTRSVLLYDNSSSYTTSMAIANPSQDTIQVTATIRDEDGNSLDIGELTLGLFVHQAFATSARWPATAGKRWIIQFRSTGWGASVLGLRFSPGGSFTSFHVLSNPDWEGAAHMTNQLAVDSKRLGDCCLLMNARTSAFLLASLLAQPAIAAYAGNHQIEAQMAGSRAARLHTTTIAAGGGHNLLIAEDGTVWAWWRNDAGQLGDGTTMERCAPVRVASLTGIVAISAGGFHSLALKSDGTIWAWGQTRVVSLMTGRILLEWSDPKHSASEEQLVMLGQRLSRDLSDGLFTQDRAIIRQSQNDLH